MSYCDLTRESAALSCATTPTPLSAIKITMNWEREREKGRGKEIERERKEDSNDHYRRPCCPFLPWMLQGGWV